MKNMHNKGLIGIIALLLALALGTAVLAEGTADNTLTDPVAEAAPTETAAADDAKAALESAQAKADAAKAEAEALNEALTAYENAKADSRKETLLENLKKELDAFVEAGKLTQEQADLILKYYAEQLTLMQNGHGSGRGMKGIRNGQGVQGADMSPRMDGNGFGRNGRQGRFNGQNNGTFNGQNNGSFGTPSFGPAGGNPPQAPDATAPANDASNS